MLCSTQLLAGYGSAGCGLGSMVLSGRGFVQVFAATTNGTSGSQTFGISSGTSNCGGGGGSASLPAFADANRLALANDIARGNGETLVTLSQTLGCEDVGQLSSTLKKHYREIFPTTEVGGEQISDSITRFVKEDADLSVSCHTIG